MKTAGAAILLAVMLAAALPIRAAVAEPRVPPGKRLDFTITWDGDEIGRQVLGFAREGGQLTVDTRVEIRVKKFFVTVHRFERSSEAGRSPRALGLAGRAVADLAQGARRLDHPHPATVGRNSKRVPSAETAKQTTSSGPAGRSAAVEISTPATTAAAPLANARRRS